MEIDIDFRDITMTVRGSYIKEEPMVMYFPDGSGYPGCPSEFEIESIFIEGVDITEIIRHDLLDELEQEILKQIE